MAVSLQAELEELGLSANEAKVYLALLELGGAKASEAAAHAGIDRTVAYTVLKRLGEKGLVFHFFREGSKIFSPAKPGRLVHILEEKVELARETVLRLEKIAPEQEEEAAVEVAKDASAIKRIYDEILNEKKDFLYFGYVGRGRQVLPQYFKIFERRRIRAGIKRRMLVGKSTLKKVVEAGFEFAEVRLLPDEFFAEQAVTIVYGRKTAIVLPVKHEMVIIFIDSPAVAEAYRKQFLFLWKTAKKP
ncbi:MAG: hypothetical protein NTY90_03790 [Candidatus Micrarchaeota archaeon]|nr:hypothetical protein [Candidatus Micrarchaeota archaeon]